MFSWQQEMEIPCVSTCDEVLRCLTSHSDIAMLFLLMWCVDRYSITAGYVPSRKTASSDSPLSADIKLPRLFCFEEENL